MADNARKWVASKEGQKALKSAIKAVQKDINALKKAREVDPKELDKPMTL